MTRLLFSVIPANEVLVQHSFRTGNQLHLRNEHCLQLNKGMHRKEGMSSHCVWLPEVLTVLTRRDKVTVESDHKPLQSVFKKSLLCAPCRLQRMMLRLQRYNLQVVYKQGTQMFVADHLSRALLKDTGLELEAINPFDTIKISSERLPQLQKATEQDPVMQTLKTTILIGWPERREEVPVQIREYWNYREELTLHNGILFKNQRVIIPNALRPELTTRAHSSHQGIEACIRRAKDVVFWPYMTKDIKEAVVKCAICAAFQVKNVKQPMQTHEIPDRP